MFKHLSIIISSMLTNTVGARHRMLSLVVSLVFTVALTSCGSDSDAPSSKIDNAEQAAHEGQYANAVAMCEDIVNSPDTASMSARDFFRVATIYALAADNDINNDENMARAARWIERARKAQPDSVAIYIERLPIEHKTAVSTALDVANSPVGDIKDFSDPEGMIDSLQIVNNHSEQ